MIKDGIININKPQNMTSAQVVGAVRRILGVKKVGHTGTLDPMATGVLPVCIGKAARIMDYLNFDLKKYRCTLEFGYITDTLDIWGKVLEEIPVKNLSEEMVRAAFEPFKGVIYQYPPMYSAVRIQGKHLYEYARKGIKPPEELKKRKVFIKELTLEDIDLDNSKVTFTVLCSKGTYIRTICQDVGYNIGFGARMTELTRLSTGILTIEDSITIEELEKSGWDNLLPTDYPLVHFGEVTVNQKCALDFLNGKKISMKDSLSHKEPQKVDNEIEEMVDPLLLKAYRVYCNQEFLGVAYLEDDQINLQAHKVFYRRNEDESI